MIAACVLAKIAYTDWKTKKIESRWLWCLVTAGILSIWIIHGVSVTQRLAGIFAVSIPLLLLVCFIPGSIGGGDIKLMAAGGFLLGFCNIWKAFVVGILAAGVCVSFLLILKRVDRKSEIALGPFLCMGMAGILLII